MAKPFFAHMASMLQGAGPANTEHEAVEDRGVAAVQDRAEALRHSRDPIGERHDFRENLGDRSGEEAEDDQRTTNQLGRGCDPGCR